MLLFLLLAARLDAAVETGGQLALDIPRTPSVPAVRPSGPPLELRQVRAVLMVILEVHTGRRPASRLRALVILELLPSADDLSARAVTAGSLANIELGRQRVLLLRDPGHGLHADRMDGEYQSGQPCGPSLPRPEVEGHPP